MEKTDNPHFDRQLESIKKAMYSVNRHVKTATNKHELYDLKNKTLQKLIKMGHAQKVKLEYSSNRRINSQQNTVVLVKVGTEKESEPFYFHMLPEKEDFKTLPHSGTVTRKELHNPKSTMSLNIAKKILFDFTGGSPKKIANEKPQRPALNRKIFASSFLDGSSRPRK